MSGFPPALSDQEKAVLRVVLDSKIVRGAELMRRLSITKPDQLVGPLKELVNWGLIEVSGELSPETLPFATLNTLPSVQEYIRAIIQQR
jgi:hypothetical protein